MSALQPARLEGKRDPPGLALPLGCGEHLWSDDDLLASGEVAGATLGRLPGADPDHGADVHGLASVSDAGAASLESSGRGRSVGRGAGSIAHAGAGGRGVCDRGARPAQPLDHPGVVADPRTVAWPGAPAA